MRMVERGEELRLALEPGDAVGIVDEQIGQQLRDPATLLPLPRTRLRLFHGDLVHVRQRPGT